MKYIFRGHIVFEYDPETKRVEQGKISGSIAAFNYCSFISEDYKLLSEFFDMAYQHTQGEISDEDLKNIEVN